MTPRSGRLAMVTVALAIAAAACGSSNEGGPDATPTPSDNAAATTVDHPVGKRSIELVDRSRPTSPDPERDLPGRPDRTIPVTLLYPADGTPEANPKPVEDAPIADGTFPLVVFSHGWTSSGDSRAYQNRLVVWASAGYVVGAPTFPLTSGPGQRSATT